MLPAIALNGQNFLALLTVGADQRCAHGLEECYQVTKIALYQYHRTYYDANETSWLGHVNHTFTYPISKS